MACLIPLAALCVFGQNVRLDGGGAKAHLAVPMIGSGTYADPRRPAFVGESGIPFRYQLSDDRSMALVEVSPRTPGELDKLEQRVKVDPRVRVFKPGTDKLADMLADFRKLKKDYDPETQSKPAVRPVAGGAK